MVRITGESSERLIRLKMQNTLAANPPGRKMFEENQEMPGKMLEEDAEFIKQTDRYPWGIPMFICDIIWQPGECPPL